MSTVAQAGAIVYRLDGSAARILLVRAKQDPSKWVFPKGHLKPGESHAAAALREANEEAGVNGIAVGLVGLPLTFPSGSELVTVEYYLVRLIEDGESPEGREKLWLSPTDALGHLSFPDARDLLRRAVLEIEEQVSSVPDEAFRELLLHEYDHVAESLLANEDSGEKRVTFFITLCGAVGAAVAFVVGDKPALGLSDKFLIVLSLLLLMLLGYVTSLRLVVRNAASDRYKNQLARIRQKFLASETDSRVEFLPFHPYTRTIRPPRESYWRFGSGGWLETMALVEALLGGAAVAFVVWAIVGASGDGVLVGAAIASGILTGCVVWRVLLKRTDALYNHTLRRDHDGAVPLRSEGGPLVVGGSE